MTYLLNTHTLIWAITEPQKLPDAVRTILEDTDNEVIVNAISFWKILLKQSIQKLILVGLMPEGVPKAARKTVFRLLDLVGTTAVSYHQLSTTYHCDPFDRMLIWQALKNNYWLISKDSNVAKYVSEELRAIW